MGNVKKLEDKITEIYSKTKSTKIFDNSLLEDAYFYLQGLIDEAKSKFNIEELTIFVGKIGVGKSTLINFLAGRKVYVKTVNERVEVYVDDPIDGWKLDMALAHKLFFLHFI